MKTLQIEQTNALKAFKEADMKGRTLLENLFGTDTFKFNPFEQIKTFEDACESLGIDPAGARPYKDPVNGRQEAVNAIEELFIIQEALNEGWEPDYKDDEQYKYYPYFEYDTSLSAFRFYRSTYGYTTANTASGARLCYETEEQAEYVGKQFIAEFNDILLIK